MKDKKPLREISSTARQKRLADDEAKEAFGVVRIDFARRCRHCRSKTYFIRPDDGMCRVCCQKEVEAPSIYKDDGADVLFMNARTKRLIEEAGIKPRTDRREPEVSVHEFYTVPRGGLSSLREVV